MTPHVNRGKMWRRTNRVEGLHDHNPCTPSHLCHSRGEGKRRVRNRNKGVKIGLRTKVRSGEKILLKLSLFSHYPTVFLIAIDYINLPQTKTTFPMMVFDKWSPVLYLNPQAFNLIFPMDLSYEDRVRELVFFNLEKSSRRYYRSLAVSKGAYKRSREGLLTRSCTGRTRSNG